MTSRIDLVIDGGMMDSAATGREDYVMIELRQAIREILEKRRISGGIIAARIQCAPTLGEATDFDTQKD